MWVREININSLKKSKRWNVEYFGTDESINHNSIFSLIKSKELVNERKESVEPYQFPEYQFNYIGLKNVESVTGELSNFSPKPGKSIILD